MESFVAFAGTTLRFIGYTGLPLIIIPVLLLPVLATRILPAPGDRGGAPFAFLKILIAWTVLFQILTLPFGSFFGLNFGLVDASRAGNFGPKFLLSHLTIFGLSAVAAFLPDGLSKAGRLLSKGLDHIANSAMWIAMSVAMLIILIQLAAVMLRYLFGISLSWMTDSIVFAFAAIFMLGVAGTLRADGHVRVDILRREMSAKQKALVDLIGAILFIVPIGILILYSGSSQIARTWLILEPFNESDGLPVKYLFISLVPTFAVLLMSQGLSQALKAAFTLRGDPIAPLPSNEPQGGAI